MSTFDRDFLIQAQDIFLCNSVCGIIPVILIDNKAYKIGVLTRTIQSELSQHVVSFL